MVELRVHQRGPELWSTSLSICSFDKYQATGIDIMALWEHVSPLMGLSEGDKAEGQWTREDHEACLKFVLVEQRS